MIITKLGAGEMLRWDHMQPLKNEFVSPAAALILPGFSQTDLIVLEGFDSTENITSADENIWG